MGIKTVEQALMEMERRYAVHPWTKERFHRYWQPDHAYDLPGMVALVCGGPITRPTDHNTAYDVLAVLNFLNTNELASDVLYQLWETAGRPEDGGDSLAVKMTRWNDARSDKETVIELIRKAYEAREAA